MRLLIHHRLWGKEPTRRYQTRAQPWQLQAAMSAFFHASHTIRASRTPWSFCLIRHLKDHRPTPQYMLVSSSRYQTRQSPKLTPCVSSKKLSRSTWLRISEPRASPQIVNGARLSPPPTVKNQTHSNCAYNCGASPPSSCGACTSTPESMTHCFNLLCQPSCIALQHPT